MWKWKSIVRSWYLVHYNNTIAGPCLINILCHYILVLNFSWSRQRESRSVRLRGYVACTHKTRNAYNFLIGETYRRDFAFLTETQTWGSIKLDITEMVLRGWARQKRKDQISIDFSGNTIIYLTQFLVRHRRKTKWLAINPLQRFLSVFAQLSVLGVLCAHICSKQPFDWSKMNKRSCSSALIL